ncbi:DUF1430 domain-containing protein [[Clostridium] innocuum]|uniref:DUF1430 domain-containing protein n=1 Tax=Clostridium innocuum TaxID=1522 RepID=UPI001E3ECC56|nr:DUF1430 domain-containing protein [[Clostridium] innocuum]
MKFAFYERDISDIQGFFGLEREKEATFFEITPQSNEFDHKQMINTMEALSQKFNCTVIRTEQHDSDYIWYLYSPYDIFQYMDISKISEHDLVYENQLRYDTKQNSLRLFNQDIRLVIQPFQNLAGDYILYFDQDTDKDAFLTDISQQYPGAIQDMGAFERHAFTLSSYLKENIIPMGIITFLLLGLLLIMLVNQKLKTIGILKSMGMSGLRIGRLLYQRLFFQILAVSLLSIVLAYIWMIGFVARQTYEAILLLSFFWIGFSIGMFLAFAGTVLLILRCPVYAFIKNRSFTRWFMNLNYLYGILALLILMPLCSTAWEQMQLNLPTFQALLRQQDMLESYVYAFDYQDGYRFDGYDEESVEEDYRNKKLIQNKMYQVHLKEYEKINREGGIYYRKDVIPKGEELQPYAEVNLNYTKRFPLRKRDGSLIELTDKKDTVYILLPESLNTVDVSYLETYGNRIERLYIQDEQVDAVDFSLLDSMLDTDSPMFYVVYSDDAFRLGKKVTNYVYMDMDKLSTLTSVHNGEHFVPSALLILLVMAEYTHLYLLSFQQRIFVRRVQGTSFFRVYLRLFTELSAPFVFVIALFHQQEEWKITGVFLMISLIASMLFVYVKDKGVRNQSREVHIG